MTCCILQITIEQTLLHSGEEVSQTDDMEKETLSQKIRSHKSLRRAVTLGSRQTVAIKT